MKDKGTVYLIPSLLDEDGLQTIPTYILEAVKNCHVFFVENERTARRYLKQLWKEMVIDDYEWQVIHKAEGSVQTIFQQKIKEGKTIGIISEAGCPGVADPGQILVNAAQQMNADVKPLVGPNSILLALMASGMNGQCFQFNGYLPIEQADRNKKIKTLETESQQKKCTQIFIETPYRNNPLIDSLLKTLNGKTKLCIAADLTGKTEFVKTKTIADWQKNIPELHKRPAIFLLQA